MQSSSFDVDELDGERGLPRSKTNKQLQSMPFRSCSGSIPEMTVLVVSLVLLLLLVVVILVLGVAEDNIIGNDESNCNKCCIVVRA